jgi:hypothetical protein
MIVGPRSLLERLLGLASATTPRVEIHSDLAVPMRDGVVLRADRYVPAARADAPVVLMRSAYGRKGLWRWLYCLPFARRGYQVVIESCRATEDSGGDLTPFDEHDDSHAGSRGRGAPRRPRAAPLAAGQRRPGHSRPHPAVVAGVAGAP